MDIIREPDGIDFVVEPTKLTKADKELISKVIAHYKATGEKLSAPISSTKKKTLKSEKELITRP
jgi:hypothetical protein